MSGEVLSPDCALRSTGVSPATALSLSLRDSIVRVVDRLGM